MNPVHAYSFETTGVVVIPKALAPEQVDRARQAIRDNWPKGAPWKFPVLHLGRVFWEMMTQPDMLQLSDMFAGSWFRVDHAFGVTSNNAPPQLHGGPQACQYASLYTPLSQGTRTGIGRLNFGFCLEGQSPETGGFCYVPGSHKSTDPRGGRQILQEVYAGKFNHPSLVVPTLRPGDMLMFAEALVHGDSGWKLPPHRQRMQVYFMVTPGFMCWRDSPQNEDVRQYAVTDLERQLVSAPWVGRYETTATGMDVTNEWRKPTLEFAHARHDRPDPRH